MSYRTIEHCRLCKDTLLEPVIDLGNHYVSTFVDAPDDTLPRAPLNLVICRSCSLAQLKDTVDADLLYRKFWYKSGVNDTMKRALENVVEDALQYVPDPKTWIDIGANDGTLFDFVPRDCKKVGVEPALNLAEELKAKSDVVISDYFSRESLASTEITQADVITSVAMFYDLDDPHPFVETVKDTLSPDGVWVNQLSYTPLMLGMNAFDNICHEHLCYYTLTNLKLLYENWGLRILNVGFNEVNGGSFRVVACREESMLTGDERRVAEILENESKVVTITEYQDFAARVKKWRQVTLDVIATMRGVKHIYGASTKGNTLLQYLSPPEGTFVCAADRNPEKWGKKMVGTWIPIVSEERSRSEFPDYLYVLPWAFDREFIKREQTLLRAGTTMVFPLPNIKFVL